MATAPTRTQFADASALESIEDPSQLEPWQLELIQQRERFNWFARTLKGRVSNYTVKKLEKLLYGEPAWPGQREKALVMLALNGTDEAGDVLRRFDPAEDQSLRPFLSAVMTEFLRRRS